MNDRYGTTSPEVQWDSGRFFKPNFFGNLLAEIGNKIVGEKMPPEWVHDRPPFLLNPTGKPFMWRIDEQLRISGSGSLSRHNIEFIEGRIRKNEKK